MSWPTDEAVKKVCEVLFAHDGSAWPDEEDAVRSALEAMGLPPLVGNTAAADLLGTDRSNLHKVVGLPDPVYEKPDAPARLWLRADIEKLAASRAERVVLAGKRLGGEPIVKPAGG